MRRPKLTAIAYANAIVIFFILILYSSSAFSQQKISGVSTKKVNDKVEIKVKDNGNGVPQKSIG